MKILVMIFIIFWSPLSFAENQLAGKYQENCFLNLSFPSYSKIFGHSILTLEKSGCCSWHNGVCGCSNGRATCCDGTLSPSCRC